MKLRFMLLHYNYLTIMYLQKSEAKIMKTQVSQHKRDGIEQTELCQISSHDMNKKFLNNFSRYFAMSMNVHRNHKLHVKSRHSEIVEYKPCKDSILVIHNFTCTCNKDAWRLWCSESLRKIVIFLLLLLLLLSSSSWRRTATWSSPSSKGQPAGQVTRSPWMIPLSHWNMRTHVAGQSHRL